VIPKECKRLAEVDFPIAEVSKHAAREKSIRHGHPSTLHLWWARRPLASSRAILLGLLWPDPCDVLCPPGFKAEARKRLREVPGCNPGDTDEDLRKALLRFIADFANWDLAANATYLDVCRALIKSAYASTHSSVYEPPLIADPFAGGGSIPLEALRLGCEAFASDLNPVACLILKVMLEDIPRHGSRLADDLRQAGDKIRGHAERELATLYPRTPVISPELAKRPLLLIRMEAGKAKGFVTVTDAIRHLQETQIQYTHYVPITKEEAHGPTAMSTMFGRASYAATDDQKWLKQIGAKPLNLIWEAPIAYLWARTVQCESPNCGAEIPLLRSFWLCKKANRKRALRYSVNRPTGTVPRVQFEVFEPKADMEVPPGTVTRAKATCLCCRSVLSPERVRAQLVAQKGGSEPVFNAEGRRVGGARLTAVVALQSGLSGRQYRVAEDADYEPLRAASAALAELSSSEVAPGLTAIPNEAVIQPRVAKNSPFRFHLYGCNSFGSLCTNRQKLALATLARDIRQEITAPAVREALALVLDKVASRNSSLCSWRYQADQEKVEHMFVRQALSFEWDFAEAAPLSESTGSFADAIDGVALASDALALALKTPGQVTQGDAGASTLPDETASVWFTDPPYYDAVPYSDLSDYFYVWMKRALPNHPLFHDPDDASNPLTPKNAEARMDEIREVDGRPKDAAFFEDLMAKAFAEGCRVLRRDGIGAVVFAHKTTEGWEALLSGIVRGGWTITASWPIATEMATRLRARDSAALATSVHLICRPRPIDAPVGDWADVLRQLPIRVGEFMERLQGEGVRGADLVFACIGPALEIYSRYTRVETAEGREVKLDQYLEKVWETVGRSALGQVLGTAEARARNGAAGALEEDARLTALFLWTLQASDGESTGDARDAQGEEEKAAEDESEEDTADAKPKGFTLVFDVVRRFAQPLGIDLPKWEGRVIDIKKGVVRLLPIAERANQLFGEDGAQAVATRLEQDAAMGIRPQLALFPDDAVTAPTVRGRPRGKHIGPELGDGELIPGREATTLDRIHAAMLLQGGGRTNALRTLLKSEQERGPEFLRLANALSALFPKASEEKRLLDAMLLATPR
jgi:adenine-specific DNA methylase